MGFFKKKKPLFEKNTTSLGRTQAKFIKPTKKELKQLRGGSRMRDTPLIKKVVKRERLVDRFDRKVDDFNSLLGSIEKIGNTGTKSRGKSRSMGSVDPKALRDPWGF